MTIESKDNRRVSMIADRAGLIDVVVRITTLQPNELNTMKLTAAKRKIDGVSMWTWRLDYVADPKKK